MRHLRRLGHSLAAGAFAGVTLTPLQLLLWPEVHLSPLKVILGLLAWTSWAAAWIGLVLFALVELAAVGMPYLASHRGFSLGLWRWLAIFDGALIASVSWYNREETRDLLLPENRHTLAVAGSLATLFTIAFVVLAIRRRPRRHAVLASLAACGALTGCVWWAWVTTETPAPAVATPEPPRFAASHRLLLVSWEGADLPWLLPAIERGDMPFLHARREAAAWGQLRTVRPYTRSAALATLVTGCAPAVHGVLGRTTYRLPWLTDTPVTLLLAGPWPAPQQLPWKAWERAGGPTPQRAPLWQILIGAGLRVGIAGWPHYAQATWTIPPLLSAELKPALALDADFRAAIEPALRSAPRFADDARVGFAGAAETLARVRRRAGTTPVDALILNFDLPAHLRPEWTAEDPGGAAEEVLRQATRMLDEHLRTLCQVMGGEDVLLVVVSPYGMAPPSPWRRLMHLAGSPQRWRVSPADSPDGFVLLSGPGVRAGTRLRGARLADVVATVLYLLELPVARDMAGRVLLETVNDDRATTVPLRLVPSYPRNLGATH